MTICYCTGQVKDFKLDDYVPYMGWIGHKKHKIYTCEASKSYFLYDESTSEFYELVLIDINSVSKAAIYDSLVNAYVAWADGQV